MKTSADNVMNKVCIRLNHKENRKIYRMLFIFTLLMGAISVMVVKQNFGGLASGLLIRNEIYLGISQVCMVIVPIYLLGIQPIMSYYHKVYTIIRFEDMYLWWLSKVLNLFKVSALMTIILQLMIMMTFLIDSKGFVFRELPYLILCGLVQMVLLTMLGIITDVFQMMLKRSWAYILVYFVFITMEFVGKFHFTRFFNFTYLLRSKVSEVSIIAILIGVTAATVVVSLHTVNRWDIIEQERR